MDRLEGIAHIQGGNHSIKVKDAIEVGMYDENYPGVALREETDMAIRLFKSGYKIVYDPEATIIHLNLSSGGCRKKSIWDDSAGLSLLYFAVKYISDFKLAVLYDFWFGFRIMVLTKTNLFKPILIIIKLVKYLYYLLILFLTKDKRD